MGTRVYALPMFQGIVTSQGVPREFQPRVSTYSHVDMDLIGPLHVSSDFRYFVTAIDRYTRWPGALNTAVTVANAFSSVWAVRFVTIRTGNLRPVASKVWLPSPDRIILVLLRCIAPPMA
jgi:hypothetical protein